MEVPEELVNLQAYILWEQQGKPDGANFGPEAAALVEGRLRAGESAAEIEAALRTPAATPAVPEQAAPAPEAPAAEPGRPAPQGAASLRARRASQRADGAEGRPAPSERNGQQP